ncbi:MAG: epoxyqueuosine reductase [archaeon]|nr:epoxyqueuosine reductase [archaeon]
MSTKTNGDSEDKKSYNKMIEEFLLERGVIKVGFVTLETMAGGPPSADLTYVLPEAQSAIGFCLPYDKEKIRAYLAKEDEESHAKDNNDLNIRLGEISLELSNWLNDLGFKSKPTHANNSFRKDVERWKIAQHPPISHRYVAVRSGIGTFGLSGNVLVEGYGANVLFGTTVTSLKLEPTDPIPEDEKVCNNCKICLKVCNSGIFATDEMTEINLGGIKFSYPKRLDYARCNCVCGGFVGLSFDKKWSTWSPGRKLVPQGPDSDREVYNLLSKSFIKSRRRPKKEGTSFKPSAMKGFNINFTCGNCNLICSGDPKETAKNYKILRNSGCVIQHEDGRFEVLPPEEAEIAFNKMSEKHRKLYDW